MWYNHRSRICHVIQSGPDRLVPRARVGARPLRIHIAVNDYCNIRCPHCLRETPGVKVNQNCLGVGDLKRLAPWFKSAMTVALAGLGEPFIQKDIFEIVDLVHSYGAAVSLITNGTLLDEATARRIVGPHPTLLNLSIDAGTPEVFEKVRLGAKFKEVVENVDRLVAVKREAKATFPVMTINMTLMRDTLNEVEPVLALARRWGICHLTAQTVMFASEEVDRSQAVTNRQAQEALARAEPSARATGIEIRYVPLASDFEGLARDEAEGDLFPPSYPYQHRKKRVPGSRRFYCPNLWHQMVIDVFGNMDYCCMADFGKVGNIRDLDPADLWNHPNMTALRRRLVRGDPPPECRKCYALEDFGRRKMLGMWRAEFGPLRQMF